MFFSGFGDSDKPLAKSEYTLDSILSELKDLVVALEREGQVTLVGHGLGGLLAWHFVDRGFESFCFNVKLQNNDFLFQTSRFGRVFCLHRHPSSKDFHAEYKQELEESQKAQVEYESKSFHID